MTTNRNFSETWPSTNKDSGPLGADNPGQQACPNCRSTVTPIPTNGTSYQNSQGNKYAAKNYYPGYSCPKCGHSFTWVKSTGKAAGPTLVGNDNQPTAADA